MPQCYTKGGNAETHHPWRTITSASVGGPRPNPDRADLFND